MIDEFLEFIATPISIIALHVLLILLNKLTIDEEDRMGLFKSIIWTIVTLIIFPSLLVMALQVTASFTLALISLGLLFLQIIMNVEFMLLDYERKQEEKSKVRGRY